MGSGKNSQGPDPLIDFGEQHKYYWKPTPKIIQYAALYILTRQEPKLYYQLCGSVDIEQAVTGQMYLFDMALWTGKYLLWRGEQLSSLLIHDHIEWAMFFAQPIVTKVCPSARMVSTPKVNWLAIYSQMSDWHEKQVQSF